MRNDEINKISNTDKDLLKSLFQKECHFQMNDDVMDEFLKLGTVIDYSRGETICSAGSMDSNIYIIISGIVCRWRWNHDKDKEVVDTFSMPGTMFIEYHSYYEAKESHAFFEACCQSRLLKVCARDFDRLIERSHNFTRWALNMAHCQLYNYELRELNLSGNVQERYEILMKERPEIIRNVAMKTIAAYLGVSPQYLSTLRKEWLNNGFKT